MSLAAVLAGTQVWHVEVAHVLDGLRALPDGCVQTVCTSPPYWGLRAYSTTPVVMGGDPDCDHLLEATRSPAKTGGTGAASAKQVTNTGSQYANRAVDPTQQQRRETAQDGYTVGFRTGAGYAGDGPKPLTVPTGGTCTRCGAFKGELGSEPTPQLFVAHLVAVLAEVRRVLRDDGTVWLNIADSYASGEVGRVDLAMFGSSGGIANRRPVQKWHGAPPRRERRVHQRTGIPAKSLCLIPERLALALQDDGWIIRSHIVYAKLAPMPESVTDRPTSAWEHVWLLTKRSTYSYDAEAVRQPQTDGSVARWGNGGERVRGNKVQDSPNDWHATEQPQGIVGGANLRNVWTLPMTDVFRLSPEPYDAEYCTACGGYYAGAAKSAIRTRTVEGTRRRVCPCGRWDAWLSHFATYPTELVRRCVLAGTSAHGACPTCGAGWRRVATRTTIPTQATYNGAQIHNPAAAPPGCGVRWAGGTGKPSRVEVETTGWAPGCTCPNAADVVPPIVLDPFSGSGTSILVAHQLGRRAIGLELNPDYAAMSRKRIEQDAPLVEAVAAAAPWAQAALFGEEGA
jgi:DNA modification methylase